MKIPTNFAKPVQNAVMPVAMATWAAALCLSAGAWMLIAEAMELRAELPQLRERLERFEAGKKPVVGRKQLPSMQELAETRTRVAKVNAVTQAKGMSASVLLGELEALLPSDAWLTSIHHRATEGEAVLVASAASSAPLSAFLLKLEHAPLFEEVMLMREMQSRGNRKPAIQFEIRLKVRS